MLPSPSGRRAGDEGGWSGPRFIAEARGDSNSLTPAPLPEGEGNRLDYSYRNASTGLSSAAFLAG